MTKQDVSTCGVLYCYQKANPVCETLSATAQEYFSNEVLVTNSTHTLFGSFSNSAND